MGASEQAMGDPEPGYYGINLRALTLGEVVRMYGRRFPWVLMHRLSMGPVGRAWLPLRPSETACRPEELSRRFFELTESHRAALSALGFQVRFADRTRPEDDLGIDDHGILHFLDPSRTQLAVLSYARTKPPPGSPALERVDLHLRAELGDELVAFCDSGAAFNPGPHARRIVVAGAGPALLHRRFAAHLRRSPIAPRAYADDQELMASLDHRYRAAVRSWVARGLYVRLGGREVAQLPGHPLAVSSGEETPRRKALGWALGLGAAWLAYRSVLALWPRRSGGGGALIEAKQQDEFCLKLLAEKPHREARAWLAEDRPADMRNLGEQSPDESRRIVEDLYGRGAVDVQAVGIDKAPDGQSANILIVRLPDLPEKRRGLFALGDDLASSQGFDGTPDVGQHHLFLWKFKASLGQMLTRIRTGR